MEIQPENYNGNRYSTGKILIVENNFLNQRILELFLDQWGIEHGHAGSSRVAMEMLNNLAFDLVLMDVQMPVMDGYITAKKIREELALQLPIIALTPHEYDSEREWCLAHGMNDCLANPVREKELYQIIQHYLPRVAAPGSLKTVNQRSNRPPGFDPSIVIQVSRGNPDYLEEMVNVFLQQTELEIQRLESALAQKDYLQVARIVQSMKSTVNYMGLKRFLNPELLKLEKLALEPNVTLEKIKKDWMLIRSKFHHRTIMLNTKL